MDIMKCKQWYVDAVVDSKVVTAFVSSQVCFSETNAIWQAMPELRVKLSNDELERARFEVTPADHNIIIERSQEND